jgi:hypothetical protein
MPMRKVDRLLYVGDDGRLIGINRQHAELGDEYVPPAAVTR